MRGRSKALPKAERARFEAEVQGFVGQKATHRRIDGRFNGHLAARRLDNPIKRRLPKHVRDEHTQFAGVGGAR